MTTDERIQRTFTALLIVISVHFAVLTAVVMIIGYGLSLRLNQIIQLLEAR